MATWLCTLCAYTMLRVLSIVGRLHVGGDVDDADSIPVVGSVETAQDDAR
jgi:hypothetical protein